MLFIARNCGVMQDIILFQLSQLEDSRRENRDLSSSSQVRLQHLWRYWRRGSHYKVWFEFSLQWSRCRPSICHVCTLLSYARYCPFNKDGAFSSGASLPQLKTRRNAAGNFSSRRYSCCSECCLVHGFLFVIFLSFSGQLKLGFFYHQLKNGSVRALM